MHKRLVKFEDWTTHKYGHDAYGNKLVIPKGWILVKPGTEIKHGWRVFDVYAGWMYTDEYQSERGHHVCGGSGYPSDAMGRWQAWIKPDKRFKRRPRRHLTKET